MVNSRLIVKRLAFSLIATAIIMQLLAMPASALYLSPSPTPAFTPLDIDNMNLSDLEIYPLKVTAGYEVSISVLVTNTGDQTDNFEVDLKIDNKVVATKNAVNLASHESRKINFIYIQNTAGTYTASIGNLTGTFTVVDANRALAPVNWWLVAILIAICLIIVWIIMRTLTRQRKPE